MEKASATALSSKFIVAKEKAILLARMAEFRIIHTDF